MGNDLVVPVEPSRRVRWLLVLLVLGLTLVAYLPALKAGFVNWDDDVYLLTNTLIRELSAEGILHIFSQPYYGQYQPLVLLSFAFDYHFAGLDPTWYHTVNVLLHVANTGLVLVLVRALSGRFNVAVMAAAIFGVHPLHVESVAWVTERKDLLYGFFYLASLIAYVNYIKRSKKWLYAIALALFLLSLLSKAQAVTLVLTLPLVDWLLYRHRDMGWRWIALEKTPFFVGALAFGSLALVVQGAAGGLAMAEPIGLADRVVYGSYNLVHHLMRLFVPVRLSAIYPNPTQEGGFSALEMLLYPSLVLILIWLTQRSLRHTQGGEASVRRGVVFGLGFVVVNVLPMLQFIPAGTAMMNDRFAYISSIGFCYLVGVGLGGLRDARPRLAAPLAIAASAYLVVLGFATWERTLVWRDGLSLWNDVLAKYPDKALAYNNRGLALAEQSRLAEAIEDYDRAIFLEPDYVKAFNNRGSAKLLRGDHEAAIRDFNQALRLDPAYAESYYNRGLALDYLGDTEGAIRDYGEAIELKPGFADAYYSRGGARANAGDLRGALEDFSATLEIAPDHARAYLRRGVVRGVLGDASGACSDWRAAAERGSDEAASRLVGCRDP